MDTDDEIVRANRAKRGSPFLNTDQAAAYLSTPLFNDDVVVALKPLLDAAPEVQIYKVV